MNTEINGIFRAVRERARSFQRSYSDRELDSLLTLINEDGFDSSYLGSGQVEDIFHYIYSEKDKEAVLTIKTVRDEEVKSDYTFLHVSLSESFELEQLIGIYSTLIGLKEPEFQMRLGKVYMEGDDSKKEYLMLGLLRDFHGARRDLGDN